MKPLSFHTNLAHVNIPRGYIFVATIQSRVLDNQVQHATIKINTSQLKSIQSILIIKLDHLLYPPPYHLDLLITLHYTTLHYTTSHHITSLRHITTFTINHGIKVIPTESFNPLDFKSQPNK